MIDVAVVAACAGFSIALAFATLWWRTRRRLAHVRAEAQDQADRAAADVRRRATFEERERIYAALHDDLGARLLGLVHTAESPQQADRARAVLQDLRDVVTRSRGTPGTLGDVLAAIRAEATQRLGGVSIELAWSEAEGLPDTALDHERALHLHRIVREAISNVIRHARAARLRVRVGHAAEVLRIELTDDGDGPPGVARSGSGMRNMRDRASSLAGDIAWVEGTEGGTKVLLEVPWPATKAAR